MGLRWRAEEKRTHVQSPQARVVRQEPDHDVAEGRHRHRVAAHGIFQVPRRPVLRRPEVSWAPAHDLERVSWCAGELVISKGARE